jgi:hypothetical protein
MIAEKSAVRARGCARTGRGPAPSLIARFPRLPEGEGHGALILGE